MAQSEGFRFGMPEVKMLEAGEAVILIIHQRSIPPSSTQVSRLHKKNTIRTKSSPAKIANLLKQVCYCEYLRRGSTNSKRCNSRVPFPITIIRYSRRPDFIVTVS